MSNCANTQIGVSSENSVDRSVWSPCTGNRHDENSTSKWLAALVVAAAFGRSGPAAHAVPAPDIEFIYDTTVRKQYSSRTRPTPSATRTGTATRSPAAPATPKSSAM